MVKLGDKVKDTVSGATGIVVSKHNYLHGCTRVSIQPAYKAKEGKLPETMTFEEPQLKVIKPKVVKKGSNKTGGFQKTPAMRSVPAR